MSGHLALVGGDEWQEGCTFDAELVEAAGADEILVLPTASAYEHPERVVAAAAEYFKGMGVGVNALDVLRRPDALAQANVDAVRSAKLIYLAGASAMHLRSVLVHSPLWDAVVTSWQNGATVVGSGAGAMALCDPMVDPRGGAFTVGLGLLDNMAVVAAADTWSDERAHRTLQLAPAGLLVVAVDERTAVIRDASGVWRSAGRGNVVAYRDGHPVALDQLP